MSTSDLRFVLYEDHGVFGVFDTAGPQVYFAETRDRAVAEVARANEVVALYPTTISMRHLREMDTAWREARGLPRLPEPEGRRLVIPSERALETTGQPPSQRDSRADHSGSTPALQAAAPSTNRIGRTLSTAAEVAVRLAMQRRVADAQADLDRTLWLSGELTTSAAAADAPIARLRSAFAGLYGDGADAAQSSFRRICLERGEADAVRALADDPRSLLNGPRARLLPGGPKARAAAVEVATLFAPAVARLDRVLDAARRHAGLPPRDPATGVADLPNRLLEMIPALRRVHADAVAEYRRGVATLATPTRLRREWGGLQPAEQVAVRRALPKVDELLRPVRARGQAVSAAAPGL